MRVSFIHIISLITTTTEQVTETTLSKSAVGVVVFDYVDDESVTLFLPKFAAVFKGARVAPVPNVT